MNNGLVAGIGDVLLRYPELIADMPSGTIEAIDQMQPYVAVHLDASAPNKIPPNPESLIAKLLAANINIIGLGPRYAPYHGNLRSQIEIVKRADKFIGTLSCFNVVAQIANVPSFVLVNCSLKEPHIYGLMNANGARIEAWNVGKSIERIYDEAVEWARLI